MPITQENPDLRTMPLISVVVPAFNEAENVENLATEIAEALKETPYEMIFIDDASTDNTKDVLTGMKARFPHLRVLAHRQNSGQSRGVRSGVRAARASIIATLDSDGQNDPADIPGALRANDPRGRAGKLRNGRRTACKTHRLCSQKSRVAIWQWRSQTSFTR